MKITAGIIALNAADTIRYTLESIYPHVDRIIIVLGAVEDYARVNPEFVNFREPGWSIDRTFAEISKFGLLNDKASKMDIIRSTVLFPNKAVMQNVMLERVPDDTDLFFKIDADEVADEMLFDSVRKAFESNPKLFIMYLKAVNFWKGLDLVAVDGPWEFPHAEIVRWKKHFRYSTQMKEGFNVLFDRKNMRFVNMTYPFGDYEVHHGKLLYHLAYSHVRGEFVQAKLKYYKHRGIEANVVDTWTNWKEGEPTSPTCPGEGRAIAYTGKIPEVLQ